MLTRGQPEDITIPPAKHAAAASGSATPTTPAVGLGGSGVSDRELKDLKAIMAQMSRQISNMALTMDVLKSEVTALKEKVGE